MNFIVLGQESYYFSKPLPSEEKKIENIPVIWHGKYQLDPIRYYQINEDGIVLSNINIITISREAVRENSKYTVRNGYIFGVQEGDSIPCVLKGEDYFFGVENKEVLIGDESKNILTETGEKGVFIVNIYEEGKYIPLLFRFRGDDLYVSSFDYKEGTKKFEKILDRTVDKKEGNIVIILKPTEKEALKLIKEINWSKSKKWIKNKSLK